MMGVEGVFFCPFHHVDSGSFSHVSPLFGGKGAAALISLYLSHGEGTI